jgi:hypothetical protein
MLFETLLRIPEKIISRWTAVLLLEKCNFALFFLYRNSKPLKKIHSKEDNVLLALELTSSLDLLSADTEAMAISHPFLSAGRALPILAEYKKRCAVSFQLPFRILYYSLYKVYSLVMPSLSVLFR